MSSLKRIGNTRPSVDKLPTRQLKLLVNHIRFLNRWAMAQQLLVAQQAVASRKIVN